MSNKPRKRRHWKEKFHHRAPPGALPGTIVADPAAALSEVRVLAFGPDDYAEKTVSDPAALRPLLAKWPVTWVNVDGLGDVNLIRKLGEIFGIHQLALEDIVHVHQQSKVEQYDDRLFLVARMLGYNGRLETEQLSLFVGERFLLTFQEDRPGDCLEPVRQQIRKAQGKIRHSGPDYLLYALLDATIDGHFPVLQAIGDRLEELEDEVLVGPQRDTVAKIHEIKHDLRTLRRVLWPERETVNALLRENTPLVKGETRVYLRDCYDHTVQIIDLLETQRELCADLMDVYLSSVSNRMNEVMRVLTVISTIFIPLSFVAGVWGMNFHAEASEYNMPELDWLYGYPLALGLMGLVAAGLVGFFWRRGWLRSFTPPRPTPRDKNGAEP